MGGCSVLGCKKRVKKGHHFYRYPRDDKRKIWAEFTGRGTLENPWEPKDSNVICESHFEEHFLERKKSRLMPKKDAIPTIYTKENATTIEKFIVTYPYSQCNIPKEFLPIDTNQAPKELTTSKKVKKEIAETKKAMKDEQKQIYERKMKLEKLKLLCRFCSVNNSTINIKNFIEFGIDVVVLMLNLEMKVEYNNYLSEAVCEECFNHIIEYTTFKGMCKAAEDRLLEEIESLVPENSTNEFPIKEATTVIGEEMKEEYLDDTSNLSEVADEENYTEQEECIEITKVESFDQGDSQEIQEMEIGDLETIEENVLIEEVEAGHYEIVTLIQDSTIISKSNNKDEEVHEVIYEVSDIKPNPVIKNETTNQYVLKVYDCVFCKTKFGGKKTYKAHICSIKEVSCDECDKVFNRPQAYKTHKANVHGLKDQEYHCPMCKKDFLGSSAKFISHRKNCSKRNDPVECEICHKLLPTLTGYSIHKLFHDSIKHNNGKSLFASTERGLCEICGKSYKTQRDYKVHMKIKHSGKNEVFQCELCPKWFTNKPAFNQHKYNSHKVQISTCSICNKTFRNKVLLRKHMIYHDEANRTHICTTCGKSFFTNVALNRHSLGHTSQRPYSCDVCSYSYTTSQQLKLHKEKSHKLQRVLMEEVECEEGDALVYELYTVSEVNPNPTLLEVSSVVE